MVALVVTMRKECRLDRLEGYEFGFPKVNGPQSAGFLGS